MPYTTTVSGGVITASWANTNVRDQVVTPFTSASARDSAITTPVTGMVEYITSNDANEGPTTRTSGNTWRRPWNIGWGVLGSAAWVSDQSTTSTGYVDVTSASIAFDNVPNRLLAASVSLPMFTLSNPSGITVDLQLYDATSGTVVQQYPSQSMGATDIQPYSATILYTAPATAGTRTWKVRFKVSANGVTVKAASYPAYFWVMDLGPAGAPA